MAKRATVEDIRPVLTELDKVVDVADETIDKVEQAVDHGVEVVEHAVETGVHVAAQGGHKAVHFLRSPRMAAIVIFSCGVAGAGFVGWKLAQRHYEKKHEEQLTREIESARNFYAKLNKAGEYATAEGAASALISVVPEEEVNILPEAEAVQALKTYQGKTDYTKPKKFDPEKFEDAVTAGLEAQERVNSNVFVDGKPLIPEDFDYDTELSKRSEDRPYVISYDEFMQNDSGYTQVSFTYYETDDTLTNEEDEAVENVDATVGTDNLTRFGHGSNDPNIVYVRNEKTELDFEVTRSMGSYAEEVQGFNRQDRTPSRRGDDG